MAIYIDNGINVNPSWVNSIAVSYDGVNWTTINKHSIDVIGSFVNKNSNPNLRHPADNGKKSTITLKREGESELILQFFPDNVVNQPTWQGDTQAALNQAISDITSWL